MAWCKWDDAEWRAHEAKQVRAYIAGRDRLWRDDQFRCAVEAALAGAELRANARLKCCANARFSCVDRLLQEQQEWDSFFKEGW